MTLPAGIRFRAEDTEDLVVLAVHMQDLITREADIAYLKAARRFALMGQRFRWELGAVPGYRIRSAFRAEGVSSVRAKVFGPDDREMFLNLLSVQAVPAAQGFAVELLFSGDRSIRLECDAIDLWLEDQGDAYPARATPDHAI